MSSKVSITNGELPALSEALAVLGAEKFGITFSFKIKRLISALKGPMETYADMRNEIIEQYARRDDSGAKVVSPDGSIVEMSEGWVPKMRELNSLEALRVAPLSAKDLIAACEALDLGISGQMLSDLGSLLVDDIDTDDAEAGVQSAAPLVYTNGAMRELLPQ